MADRPITSAVMNLSSALLGAGVLVDRVEVSLPAGEWWSMHCAIDRELGGFVTFDGRGALDSTFKLCGITFRRAA